MRGSKQSHRSVGGVARTMRLLRCLLFPVLFRTGNALDDCTLIGDHPNDAGAGDVVDTSRIIGNDQQPRSQTRPRHLFSEPGQEYKHDGKDWLVHLFQEPVREADDNNIRFQSRGRLPVDKMVLTKYTTTTTRESEPLDLDKSSNVNDVGAGHFLPDPIPTTKHGTTPVPVDTPPSKGAIMDARWNKASSGTGQSRITNGSAAQPGEFPLHARVYSLATGVCGGTLILPDIVLTAASCQDQFQPDTMVYIGATALDGSDSRERFPVQSFVRHPDFQVAEVNLNDLMVVKLNGRSTQGQLMQLESRGVADNLATTAIGFGRTGNATEFSSTLQKTSVSTVNLGRCSTDIGRPINRTTHMCARAPNTGICEGDIGGPLLNRENATIQFGIAVFSVGCPPGNIPTAYTRVSFFIPWIQAASCRLTGIPEGAIPWACLEDTVAPTTATATRAPTPAPTQVRAPTLAPTTARAPNQVPTLAPTAVRVPNQVPTLAPTILRVPNNVPTLMPIPPATMPTISPTKAPNGSPTKSRTAPPRTGMGNGMNNGKNGEPKGGMKMGMGKSTKMGKGKGGQGMMQRGKGKGAQGMIQRGKGRGPGLQMTVGKDDTIEMVANEMGHTAGDRL